MNYSLPKGMNGLHVSKASVKRGTQSQTFLEDPHPCLLLLPLTALHHTLPRKHQY